jgi:hypothetical protein
MGESGASPARWCLHQDTPNRAFSPRLNVPILIERRWGKVAYEVDHGMYAVFKDRDHPRRDGPPVALFLAGLLLRFSVLYTFARLP